MNRKEFFKRYWFQLIIIGFFLVFSFQLASIQIDVSYMANVETNGFSDIGGNMYLLYSKLDAVASNTQNIWYSLQALR